MPVLSGTNPRAVLLNDYIYMNGSRSNSVKLWKYSISKNTFNKIEYPIALLNSVLNNEHTIAEYQSQLLWIGKCFNEIAIFKVRNNEGMDSWKEITPNFEFSALSARSAGISSVSEGKYLVIVISEPRLLSVLIFDGQEWRRRDGPDCIASTHGKPDVIIHDGSIFLMTYKGFYKASLDSILATNNPQWKSLTTVIKMTRSNLTSFDGQIVVLIPGNGYVRILMYESTLDTWIMLEKLECHICWVIPTIAGFCGGLFIFGVVPQAMQTQFNILEVMKGMQYSLSCSMIVCIYACLHAYFVSVARAQVYYYCILGQKIITAPYF